MTIIKPLTSTRYIRLSPDEFSKAILDYLWHHCKHEYYQVDPKFEYMDVTHVNNKRLHKELGVEIGLTKEIK